MESGATGEQRVDHDAYPPGYLHGILRIAKTIAIVGASTDPWRPSFGIMRYLQRSGYRTIPVNPFSRGKILHGERVHGSLRELEARVDLVNVFRRPEFVGEVVDDAMAIGAPALWMQLGVRDDAACARAEAAGMKVVMNRCISVEHARWKP